MTDSVELPPKPDRDTGEPRPPKAPVTKNNAERSVPWNQRRVPQPPAAEARVLEWYYANRKIQVAQFAFMAIVGITFGSIIDGGFGWMRHWGVWVVLALGSLLLLAGARVERYSAGADWVMHRKDFAKTYELASVKFVKNFGDGTLELKDENGSGVSLNLTWLWHNSAMWDLVYNGIRHSVANGAYVNDDAVIKLRLYDVALIGEQRRGMRFNR